MSKEACRKYSNWIETEISGIYRLNQRGHDELGEYLKVHGDRIRKEHNEIFNILWNEYIQNEDKGNK